MAGKSKMPWLGLVVGAALAAAIIGSLFKPGANKVTIGSHDEIFYYRRATRENALALGHALQQMGFLTDRGTNILLWMGGGEPTTISFIVANGAWERPSEMSNFAEIGRRVATTVGGFPIQVNLVDAGRNIRRKITVGKILLGGNDSVYYYGRATEADAKALGAALQSAGYFTGAGATVALLKGEGRVISFVVQDGLWEQSDVVMTLDRLVRQIAPAVGGRPVILRLLNRNMEVEKEMHVQ